MSEALPQPESPKHKPKSLSEIFNEFSAEAVVRFPHLKGQLLVINMDEHKAYGNKDIDTKKTGLTPDTALDYVSNHPITKAMEKDKGMSSAATRDDKRNLSLVFMNESVDPKERAAVSLQTEQHLLFVMDHELAHCAIKDGFSKNVTSSRDYNILLGESVADAYAMIRHYQRYGVDSQSQNKYVSPAGRADGFILFGDTTHFTSFVLDAINKRKNEIDFDKLDPQQTADLARRFALAYMPPKRVVEDLSWDFGPIRNEFSKNLNGGVKALIEKTLAADDYYTFKFGSLWLNGFLEHRTLPDGRPINLPKEYLDDAAKKLKEREIRFAKEDILFNMPTIQQPLPPTSSNFRSLQMQAAA